jgi:hypothetical protein
MSLMMILCVFLEEESNLRIFFRKPSCFQMLEAEYCYKERTSRYSESYWLQCSNRIILSYLKNFNESCWMKNLGKGQIKGCDGNIYIFPTFNVLRSFRKRELFQLFIHLYSCYSLWSIGHPWNASFHFCFLILYTVSRTPWTSDQLVARPLPTHRAKQTQNKRRQTSVARVGFEPTIPVLERDSFS